MTQAMKAPALVMGLAMAFALVLLAGSTPAQTERSKAFVGAWRGEVRFLNERGDPTRNLVILSVNEADGKWTADGLYGISSANGRVKIDIDLSGQWPSIRFVTGSNSIIKLNLVSEKVLTGSITWQGATNSGTNERAMILKRVE